MFTATMMMTVGLCFESAEQLCDWLASTSDDDYVDVTETDVEAWFDEMLQLSENSMTSHNIITYSLINAPLTQSCQCAISLVSSCFVTEFR
jgi:hypothetical protein